MMKARVDGEPFDEAAYARRISSQATYNTEVHPTVVWAKFQAMAEGARLASRQLWGR